MGVIPREWKIGMNENIGFNDINVSVQDVLTYKE